jgi:hypothetical protein
MLAQPGILWPFQNIYKLWLVNPPSRNCTYLRSSGGAIKWVLGAPTNKSGAEHFEQSRYHKKSGVHFPGTSTELQCSCKPRASFMSGVSQHVNRVFFWLNLRFEADIQNFFLFKFDDIAKIKLFF